MHTVSSGASTVRLYQTSSRTYQENMVDVAAYLERVAYSGSRTCSADTLRDIHRAHLFSVPIENLDIGTIVLHRTKKGWKIVHLHASEVPVQRVGL